MVDPRPHSLTERLGRATFRALGALEKVATGFPLHSECVWPGRKTDLFVAHQAVYAFFGQWASGRRILDAGSGAGYGSRMLQERGAASVLGVDLDERHVRYARRHFGAGNISFEVANCESLQLAPASLDLVVSSNVIEHLRDPAAFLEAAGRGLTPEGEMLLAVPWIVDETSRNWSSSIEFHHSNFSAEEWATIFARLGWRSRQWVQTFHQDKGVPDFFDPRSTRRRLEDFPFIEVTLEGVARAWSLGIVFLLTRGHGASPEQSPS